MIIKVDTDDEYEFSRDMQVKTLHSFLPNLFAWSLYCKVVLTQSILIYMLY